MTEKAYIADGLSAVEFRFHEGFAEAEPYFTLQICGKQVSTGDTPRDALMALLGQLSKLEAFKASIEKVVIPPTRPWAGRTGDYE